MNREFAENALKPVEPEKVYQADGRSTLPKTTAEMVLGYEPVNRKDRRKAAKLLRSGKY